MKLRLIRYLVPLAAAALVALPLTAASASPAHPAAKTGVTPLVTCSGGYEAAIASPYTNGYPTGAAYFWDGNTANQDPVELNVAAKATNYCFFGGGGYGEMVQYGTNTCLTYDQGNGGLVVVWTCNGSAAQEWHSYFEGYYLGQDLYAFCEDYNGWCMDEGPTDIGVESYAGQLDQLFLWATSV